MALSGIGTFLLLLVLLVALNMTLGDASISKNAATRRGWEIRRRRHNRSSQPVVVIAPPPLLSLRVRGGGGVETIIPTVKALARFAMADSSRTHPTHRKVPPSMSSSSSSSSIERSKSGSSSSSSSIKRSTYYAMEEGTASISSEIFNLVKSIVGAGVLGLPAGIAAAGGNQASAVLPAIVLMMVIGGLAQHGFYLVGALAAQTGSENYRQTWSRAVGPKTSWLPAAACLIVAACTVLTYSMILADTIPAIVRASASIAKINNPVLTNLLTNRNEALVSVTCWVLLPLCLLKELRKLAPFSLLGIMGTLYTTTAMTVRLLDASYKLPVPVADGDSENAVAGQFVEALAQQYRPRFGTTGDWKAVLGTTKAAILISMLSTAFMAHYNAPKFYWELKDRNLERYGTVCKLGFTAAVLLMGATAAAGFLTFGTASSSVILNNYAASDLAMSLARVAVTISIVCSYPLAFVGLRDGVLDLIAPGNKFKKAKLSAPATVLLLALVTAAAIELKNNIGMVLALGSATLGCCIIYIFPAWMLLSLAKKNKAAPTNAVYSRSQSSSGALGYRFSGSQVRAAVLLGILGVTLMGIGSFLAVKTYILN